MAHTVLKEKIVASILNRFAAATEQREEALSDVLGLTVPGIDETDAQKLAALVPQLPVDMYARWAALFADRLLETVPAAQVEELCLGTEESEATLALVYVMFMESERMEKTVAEDLKELGLRLSGTDEDAALLGAWLRSRMTTPCQ